MTGSGWAPGQVVTATVKNQRQARGDPAKQRPVILVSPADVQGWWSVMGLTTRPDYALHGGPRTPVPDPVRLGIGPGPSYFWGWNLTRVPARDLRMAVGWITPEVFDELAGLVNLSVGQLAGLREAVAVHHPQVRGPR